MLSALVDEVQAPGVSVEITRHGRVAAVLIGRGTRNSLIGAGAQGDGAR